MYLKSSWSTKKIRKKNLMTNFGFENWNFSTIFAQDWFCTAVPLFDVWRHMLYTIGCVEPLPLKSFTIVKYYNFFNNDMAQFSTELNEDRWSTTSSNVESRTSTWVRRRDPKTRRRRASINGAFQWKPRCKRMVLNHKIIYFSLEFHILETYFNNYL